MLYPSYSGLQPDRAKKLIRWVYAGTNLSCFSITKPSKLQWGFSLVEFIVVVAFIMVLAIGLVAAINPLELARQARDQKYLSAATEFWKANAGYLRQRGQYPWGTATFTARPVAEMSDEVAELVKRNQLPDNYLAKNGRQIVSGLVAVFINDQLAVCFKPLSGKYRTDQINIAAVTSSAPKTSCKPPLSPTDEQNCYYCVK